ncbi:MAG: YdeI/OmpD-associated family protein [Isosphaeraceae bacterium]
MDPVFFESPLEFRAWLIEHHATVAFLVVGFHKTRTGRPSMTWPESVDEALCFGWIDGVRKRIDADRYHIRFTPRKPTSVWSSKNIARVAELTALGRMQPTGLAAFAARKAKRSGIYSFEQDSVEFPDTYWAILRENPTAHAFFESQPPSYRRVATWWVISAKKEETRLRRLDLLIHHSARAERVPQFVSNKPSG